MDHEASVEKDMRLANTKRSMTSDLPYALAMVALNQDPVVVELCNNMQLMYQRIARLIISGGEHTNELTSLRSELNALKERWEIMVDAQSREEAATELRALNSLRDTIAPIYASEAGAQLMGTLHDSQVFPYPWNDARVVMLQNGSTLIVWPLKEYVVELLLTARGKQVTPETCKLVMCLRLDDDVLVARMATANDATGSNDDAGCIRIVPAMSRADVINMLWGHIDAVIAKLP